VFSARTPGAEARDNKKIILKVLFLVPALKIRNNFLCQSSVIFTSITVRDIAYSPNCSGQFLFLADKLTSAN